PATRAQPIITKAPAVRTAPIPEFLHREYPAMKAGHRKELQTNMLADSMGRLLQEIRARPQSASIVLWVLGVLAVVIVVVWYFTAGASKTRSALWVQLEADSYN